MDQWPPHGRRLLRHPIRLLQQTLRAAQPGIGIVMNAAEGFVLLHRVADFLVQNEANRRINHVIFLFAAAAQHQAGDSHLLALDGVYESAGRTEDGHAILCLGQARGIVNSAGVAALLHNDLTKFLKCVLVTNNFVRQLAARSPTAAAPLRESAYTRRCASVL